MCYKFQPIHSAEAPYLVMGTDLNISSHMSWQDHQQNEKVAIWDFSAAS